MVDHDVVSIGVVLLGMAVSLARLWLRLRFRMYDDRERRLYLHAASAMPAGSRIQERRHDGSQVTVTVGGTIRKSPDE